MQYNPPPPQKTKNKKTNKQNTNLPKPSSISSSPRLNVCPDPGTLHGVKLTPNVPKSHIKTLQFNASNQIRAFNTTSNSFMKNDSD